MTTAAMDDGVRVNAMNANLAENWWIVALRGVLAVLFGIVAFVWPGLTMLSMVYLFAGYSIVDGAMNIALAVRGARQGERWGLLLLNGILSLIAGIVAAAWPDISIVAFILVLGCWAVFTGVLMIAAAFQVKRNHGKWWLGLGGLASIIYGVLLFISPLIGALVFTWWVGAHALVLGATLLVLAYRLRAHRGEKRQGFTTAQAS